MLELVHRSREVEGYVGDVAAEVVLPGAPQSNCTARLRGVQLEFSHDARDFPEFVFPKGDGTAANGAVLHVSLVPREISSDRCSGTTDEVERACASRAIANEDSGGAGRQVELQNSRIHHVVAEGWSWGEFEREGLEVEDADLLPAARLAGWDSKDGSSVEVYGPGDAVDGDVRLRAGVAGRKRAFVGGGDVFV